MADPLQTLLRLRRMAVDQARRSLAECLRRETEASVRVKEIAEIIDRETDAVCQAGMDDRAVHDFAAWLKRVRTEERAATEALLTAEVQTQEARTVLAAGRAAVETVEALIEQRQAERRAAQMRQEQKVLDEIKPMQPPQI
jgi:flagellar export protein FliJ